MADLPNTGTPATNPSTSSAINSAISPTFGSTNPINTGNTGNTGAPTINPSTSSSISSAISPTFASTISPADLKNIEEPDDAGEPQADPTDLESADDTGDVGNDQKQDDIEYQPTYAMVLTGQHSGRRVAFNTMPAFYETSDVGYSTLSPQHLIGDYKIFEHTSSRVFEFSEIKLVSRNPQEARDNLERIQFLKAWTKPYFGSTEGSQELSDWLGSPPEIVEFSMYNSPEGNGIFKKIPTVIGKVGVDYPNDCDYIPTAYRDDADKLGGIPFPLVTRISLTLTEQHSPFEYEKFNLDMYRNGTLAAW